MLTACFARALQRWTTHMRAFSPHISTSATRAGTLLAELSFSLQRASSGSAVRISAPALTLKRPSVCRSV